MLTKSYILFGVHPHIFFSEYIQRVVVIANRLRYNDGKIASDSMVPSSKRTSSAPFESWKYSLEWSRLCKIHLSE